MYIHAHIIFAVTAQCHVILFPRLRNVQASRDTTRTLRCDLGWSTAAVLEAETYSRYVVSSEKALVFCFTLLIVGSTKLRCRANLDMSSFSSQRHVQG